MIKQMAALGLDVNVRAERLPLREENEECDQEGATPLIYAALALRPSAAAVRALLECGADPCMPDKHGR